MKSVEKWIVEHDKEMNTSTWLKYTVIDRLHVDRLMCSVCAQFKSKLEGMSNYIPAFIESYRNLQTSRFEDCAVSSNMVSNKVPPWYTFRFTLILTVVGYSPDCDKMDHHWEKTY